ncbi:MAG TPA: glycosyltransferase 87 family protein [Roseiflexaceae bacterium]|nr:glycosyltransferase 87 family protein [Roseiflexaceae bacterium]
MAWIPLILIPALWIVLVASNRELGIDFFPLYFAAGRVVAGLSPYGSQATAELARLWQAPFATAGIAYPLPFLVLVLPLAFLPFAIAAGLWILTGVAGVAASLRLAEDWRPLILLPLLFLPVYRGVVLGQATLVWFGLAVLLLLGIRYRWDWAVGISAALLLLKPQNGLLFGIAGLIWAMRAERRALLWFVGVEGFLAIVAIVLQPGWLAAWLAQIQTYNAIVHPPSLLPWGLVLALVAWRQPWWSIVAACQVVFFPLSDLYSALPLLLCWIAIGGRVALFGASISWIWSLAGLPNSLIVLWSLIICPLMLGMFWRSWGERLFSRQSAVGRSQLS